MKAEGASLEQVLSMLEKSRESTAVRGITGWLLPRAARDPMNASEKKKNTSPTRKNPSMAASVILMNSFILSCFIMITAVAAESGNHSKLRKKIVSR